MSYLRKLFKTLAVNSDGTLNQEVFSTFWEKEVWDFYSRSSQTQGILTARDHTKKTELLRLALELDIDTASTYILEYLSTYDISIQQHDDYKTIQYENLETEIYALKKQYPELWEKALSNAKPKNDREIFQLNIEQNKQVILPQRLNDQWLECFIAIAKRCSEEPLQMREKMVKHPELLGAILQVVQPKSDRSGRTITGRYEIENLLARDIDQWFVPMITPNDAITENLLELFRLKLEQHQEKLKKKDNTLIPELVYATKDLDPEIQTKIMQVIFDEQDIRKLYHKGGRVQKHWDEHDFQWMTPDQKLNYVKYLYEEKKEVPAQLESIHTQHVLSNVSSRKDKNLILKHLFTNTNARKNLQNEDLLIHRLRLFQEKFDYSDNHLYWAQSVTISNIMDICLDRKFDKACIALESTRLYQYLVLDALLVFRNADLNVIDHHISFLTTASEWISTVHHKTEHLNPIKELIMSHVEHKPLSMEQRLKTIDLLGKLLLPQLNISLKTIIESYETLCKEEFINSNTTHIKDHITNVVKLTQMPHLEDDKFDIDIEPSV